MNFIKKTTIFTFFVAGIGNLFCPRHAGTLTHEQALECRERTRWHHLHEFGYGVDGNVDMTPAMLDTIKETPLRRQMAYDRAARFNFLRKVLTEMGRLGLLQDGGKENCLDYSALFEKAKNAYLDRGDVEVLKNIFKARVCELVVLAKGETLESNLGEIPFIFDACERLKFLSRCENNDKFFTISQLQAFFEDTASLEITTSVLDLLKF